VEYKRRSLTKCEPLRVLFTIFAARLPAQHRDLATAARTRYIIELAESENILEKGRGSATTSKIRQ